jgi:hypothetical protein
VNALQAIGLFIGLPLLFGVVVYLLVSAPGWIRDSRPEDQEEGGPLLVVSGRPLPDPARLPSEMSPADSTKLGGVSTRW